MLIITSSQVHLQHIVAENALRIPEQDNILTNSTWAWTTIVLLAVWQSCAFAIILYLAGLQTIPEELYEAALDGASQPSSSVRLLSP